MFEVTCVVKFSGEKLGLNQTLDLFKKQVLQGNCINLSPVLH